MNEECVCERYQEGAPLRCLCRVAGGASGGAERSDGG